MEKQLFDWEEWDSVGEMSFIFYNIILKVNIGKHKIGEKFNHAYIDYDIGTLQLYLNKDDTIPEEYKLFFAEITEL